jgi:hypothetical protein
MARSAQNGMRTSGKEESWSEGRRTGFGHVGGTREGLGGDARPLEEQKRRDEGGRRRRDEEEEEVCWRGDGSVT